VASRERKTDRQPEGLEAVGRQNESRGPGDLVTIRFVNRQECGQRKVAGPLVEARPDGLVSEPMETTPRPANAVGSLRLAGLWR
jgi:hypothetical protein